MTKYFGINFPARPLIRTSPYFHSLSSTSGKSGTKTYLFDQNPLPFHGKVLMDVAESELNPEFRPVLKAAGLLRRRIAEGKLWLS